MGPVPSEFAIGGIYVPPLLIASFVGLMAAGLTARLLNHLGWSRYFFYPPLAFVGFFVIYTLLIGTFFIGI